MPRKMPTPNMVAIINALREYGPMRRDRLHAQYVASIHGGALTRTLRSMEDREMIETDTEGIISLIE